MRLPAKSNGASGLLIFLLRQHRLTRSFGGTSFKVVGDHRCYKLIERDFMVPAELGSGLGSIADEQVDLRGTKVARIDLNQNPTGTGISPLFFEPRSDPLDAYVDLSKCLFHKFAH